MTPTEHNPQNPDATAQQQDRERERVVGKFACQARIQGTAGGNYPADCEWPNCICDGQAHAPLALAERLQLALERVGVKLTTGQVLLVAAEIGR